MSGHLGWGRSRELWGMTERDCGEELYNSINLIKIIEFIFKTGEFYGNVNYLNTVLKKVNPSFNFYLYLSWLC